MSTSFWMREALQRDSQVSEPLDGSLRVDVCIVGGGYTGLWTALRLKEAEPGIEVVVVEADICGAGGSGANAGYAAPYWVHFQNFEAMAGTDEALRLCREAAHAPGEITALAANNGIDLQLQPNGVIWGATCAEQTGHWSSTVKRLEEFQLHPMVPITPEEITARTGAKGFVAGVYEAQTPTLQPGLLVRGLRKLALAAGVKIFEHTAMTRLDRSAPPRVVTNGGVVTADKVVLALYAWSLRIPELRRAVVAMRSDGYLTQPQPDKIQSLSWQDGPALMSSHHFTEACRTTPAGRVLFNKPGGGLAHSGNVGQVINSTCRSDDEMRRALSQYYPSLADTPLEAHWSGLIDRTKSGLPIFGHLQTCPDVLYGFGYSGRGIVPTFLGGKILCALVREQRDEWSECPLVRPVHEPFPPEPIKYFGGRLVLKALERADRLDHEHKPHDLFTRTLSKLKPGHWSRRR